MKECSCLLLSVGQSQDLTQLPFGETIPLLGWQSEYVPMDIPWKVHQVHDLSDAGTAHTQTAGKAWSTANR